MQRELAENYLRKHISVDNAIGDSFSYNMVNRIISK